MSEHVHRHAGVHQVVNRPLRHDDLNEETEYGHEHYYNDLHNYERLECVECGLTVQGDPHALVMTLREQACTCADCGRPANYGVPGEPVPLCGGCANDRVSVVECDDCGRKKADTRHRRPGQEGKLCESCSRQRSRAFRDTAEHWRADR